MTIGITFKVTNGVVFASDNAAAFLDNSRHTPVKIYNNVHMIFDLIEHWPIGAMAYGVGGIGSASIETLTKELHQRLTSDPRYIPDRDTYTVEELAGKARSFLYDETYLSAYPAPISMFSMGYRVCGYSANAVLPEIWEFSIQGASCIGPYELQSPAELGIRWAGENEALDRLLLGETGGFRKMLVSSGYTESQVQEIYEEAIAKLRPACALPAMPIHDAVEMSRFLVELATKCAPFDRPRPSIRGLTEIAMVTQRGGFEWVDRRRLYGDEINAEIGHEA